VLNQKCSLLLWLISSHLTLTLIQFNINFD